MSSNKHSHRQEAAKASKEQTEAYEPNELFERYEIIQGIRYDFQPSPGFHHQLLVTELWQSLHQTCHPSGVVVVAPMDVHLDEDKNTVQPDVVYIRNENLHIVHNQRIEGVPDLLVEILSKGTGKHRRRSMKHSALPNTGLL